MMLPVHVGEAENEALTVWLAPSAVRPVMVYDCGLVVVPVMVMGVLELAPIVAERVPEVGALAKVNCPVTLYVFVALLQAPGVAVTESEQTGFCVSGLVTATVTIVPSVMV